MAVRVADKIKQMNDAEFYLMDAEDIEIDGKSLKEKVEEMDAGSDGHASNKSNPHSVTKTQVGLGNVTNDKQATKVEFDAHTGNKENPHGVTKTQVGLGNVDNTADANKSVASAKKLTTARKINGVSFNGTADITIEDSTKIPLTQKGAANGVAELDENGLIPSSQLPGYVDDTVEGTLSTFPNPGESGKIYVDKATNLTYRWSGSGYVEISKSIALGETSSTAYAGNKGKQNATDIASLKTRMTDVENNKASKSEVDEALEGKVDKTTYAEDMELKADLVDGVIPEESLPYFNKSDTLFANGDALYGTRFADIDEDGEIVIRDDGEGDYLITVLEDGTVKVVKVKTHIADTLDSDSGDKALSAKQGNILASWIGVIGDLLTTAKTNIVSAVNELFNSLKSHKEDVSNPHSVTKSQIGLGNVSNIEQASKTEFNTHKNDTSNPHSVTKAQIGLGSVDNTADNAKIVLSASKLTTGRKINGVTFDGSKDITIEDSTKIPTSQKGAAGGVAELDGNGMVPAAQLPSYVDDIIEGTLATFPATGESGKIYLDTGTNLTYRWSGSAYVEVSKSVALGETASTAYAGNKGKKNAEDIADLQGRMGDVENGKVDKETYDAEMQSKADLENGIVPDAQLPYYNRTQNVYVDGTLLYPVTFLSVNADGDIYLTDDGSGDYLLFVPPDGVPRIRYMGNAITDDVTGVSYSFTVSNGKAVLKEII